MKKFLIATTIFSAISTSAFATPRSDYFSGINATIGVAAVGANLDIELHSTTANSTNSLGNNSPVAVINLTSLCPITDKWLFGIGASYDLNSIRTGESTNNSGGYFSAKSKASNHYSVYVQPTYALSENNALFAKVGYHSTRIELGDNGQLIAGGITTYKNTLNGIGYGFGLMTFLERDIFLKTELEIVQYQKAHVPSAAGDVSYKLNTVSGILSLGYRF